MNTKRSKQFFFLFFLILVQWFDILPLWMWNLFLSNCCCSKERNRRFILVHSFHSYRIHKHWLVRLIQTHIRIPLNADRIIIIRILWSHAPLANPVSIGAQKRMQKSILRPVRQQQKLNCSLWQRSAAAVVVCTSAKKPNRTYSKAVKIVFCLKRIFFFSWVCVCARSVACFLYFRGACSFIIDGSGRLTNSKSSKLFSTAVYFPDCGLLSIPSAIRAFFAVLYLRCTQFTLSFQPFCVL